MITFINRDNSGTVLFLLNQNYQCIIIYYFVCKNIVKSLAACHHSKKRKRSPIHDTRSQPSFNPSQSTLPPALTSRLPLLL